MAKWCHRWVMACFLKITLPIFSNTRWKFERNDYKGKRIAKNFAC